MQSKNVSESLAWLRANGFLFTGERTLVAFPSWESVLDAAVPACSYCNTNGSDDDCDGCNGSGRVAFEHDPDLISDDDLYSLWRDGCDAFNVHGTRNGQPDSDGGYALKSRQM